MAVNPVFHSRTKHTEIAIHFVREKVEAKELEVRYVPTEFPVADIFTKPLAVNRFDVLKHKLNIRSSQFSLRDSIEAKGLDTSAYLLALLIC